VRVSSTTETLSIAFLEAYRKAPLDLEITMDCSISYDVLANSPYRNFLLRS
jgi:hypothetical protein